MKKISTLLLVMMSALFFSSCEMFINPLWKDGRNLSDSLKNVSAQDVVDLLNSNQALSANDSKAITNVLAEKSASELRALSPRDKGTIINVAASGILPSPDEIITLIDIDSFDTMTEEDTKQLLNDMLATIDTDVKTDAIEVFFNDTSSVKSLLLEKPDALIMGTVALGASIATESGIIETAINDPEGVSSMFTLTASKLEGATDENGNFIEGHENEIFEALKADLDAISPKLVGQAEALANVVIAVYEVTQTDPESLGGLTGLFETMFGVAAMNP